RTKVREGCDVGHRLRAGAIPAQRKEKGLDAPRAKGLGERAGLRQRHEGRELPFHCPQNLLQNALGSGSPALLPEKEDNWLHCIATFAERAQAALDPISSLFRIVVDCRGHVTRAVQCLRNLDVALTTATGIRSRVEVARHAACEGSVPEDFRMREGRSQCTPRAMGMVLVVPMLGCTAGRQSSKLESGWYSPQGQHWTDAEL